MQKGVYGVCVQIWLADNNRAHAATQQNCRYRRKEEREAESRADSGDSLAKGVVGESRVGKTATATTYVKSATLSTHANKHDAPRPAAILY